MVREIDDAERRARCIQLAGEREVVDRISRCEGVVEQEGVHVEIQRAAATEGVDRRIRSRQEVTEELVCVVRVGQLDDDLLAQARRPEDAHARTACGGDPEDFEAAVVGDHQAAVRRELAVDRTAESVGHDILVARPLTRHRVLVDRASENRLLRRDQQGHVGISVPAAEAAVEVHAAGGRVSREQHGGFFGAGQRRRIAVVSRETVVLTGLDHVQFIRRMQVAEQEVRTVVDSDEAEARLVGEAVDVSQPRRERGQVVAVDVAGPDRGGVRSRLRAVIGQRTVGEIELVVLVKDDGVVLVISRRETADQMGEALEEAVLVDVPKLRDLAAAREIQVAVVPGQSRVREREAGDLAAVEDNGGRVDDLVVVRVITADDLARHAQDVDASRRIERDRRGIRRKPGHVRGHIVSMLGTGCLCTGNDRRYGDQDGSDSEGSILHKCFQARL